MKFGFELAVLAAALSGAAAWTFAESHSFSGAERAALAFIFALFFGFLAWCQADRVLRSLRWFKDLSLSAWGGMLAAATAGLSSGAVVVLVPYGIWPYWWVLVPCVIAGLLVALLVGFLAFLMALVCLEPFERALSERWRTFRNGETIARLRFRRRVKTVGLELNVLYQIERRFACEDRTQHENLACMAFSYRRLWLAQSKARWGKVGYPVAYACSLLLWRCAPGFTFTVLRGRGRLKRWLKLALALR